MITQNAKNSIATVLRSLIASGFCFPLQLVVNSANGAKWDIKVHWDGSTSDENVAGDMTSLPLTFDFFDAIGQHHRLILVDGEEQAQQEMSKGATIQ